MNKYELDDKTCKAIKDSNILFLSNVAVFEKIKIRLPFGLYLPAKIKYKKHDRIPFGNDSAPARKPKLRLIEPLKPSKYKPRFEWSVPGQANDTALSRGHANELAKLAAEAVVPSDEDSFFVNVQRSSSNGTEETLLPHSLSTYFVLEYAPNRRYTTYFEQNLGHKIVSKTKIDIQTGYIVVPYKNTVKIRKIVSSLEHKTLRKMFSEFVFECNKTLFTHCNF